jgi:hypothetical protein
MAGNPELRSVFEKALGRLSEPGSARSEKQRPVVQRTPIASPAEPSRSTQQRALRDAADALAALWKAKTNR